MPRPLKRTEFDISLPIVEVWREERGGPGRRVRWRFAVWFHQRWFHFPEVDFTSRALATEIGHATVAAMKERANFKALP
jgi:hypothetical protein